MAAGPDDLHLAALVFLQGSERPNGGRPVQVDIGPGAVASVASVLAGCEDESMSAIAGAVARYRQDGSWRSRESIIEAVTVAVVPATGG